MSLEPFVVSPTMAKLLGQTRMAQLATAFDVQIGRFSDEYRKRPVGRGPAADERAAEMANLYRSGKTLEQIGLQYGLTRERVRQILKSTGVKKTDRGGVKEAAVARTEERRMRAVIENAKALDRFGLTSNEYRQLRRMNREMREQGRGNWTTPTYAFTMQKNNAKRRGIEWKLTLAEWWAIWQASGKWDERGRGRYGLLRHGNTGPFVIGNVFVGKWKRGRGSWASIRGGHQLAEAAA